MNIWPETPIFRDTRDGQTV